MAVQDLPLHDSMFTFFSYGPFGARNRLDHFLISRETRLWCHNVLQRVMFRLISDHIPIVLSSGQFSSELKPFRFFNIWCKDPDLQSLVSSTWQELDFSSSTL